MEGIEEEFDPVGGFQFPLSPPQFPYDVFRIDRHRTDIRHTGFPRHRGYTPRSLPLPVRPRMDRAEKTSEGFSFFPDPVVESAVDIRRFGRFYPHRLRDVFHILMCIAFYRITAQHQQKQKLREYGACGASSFNTSSILFRFSQV